jgi:capsular polysaccharide biosynthesis protein
MKLYSDAKTMKIHNFEPRNCYQLQDILLNSQTGLVYAYGNRLVANSSSWPEEELLKDSYRGSSLLKNSDSFRRLERTPYTCLPSSGFYHWLIEDLPRYLTLRNNSSEPFKTIVYSRAPKYVTEFCETMKIEPVHKPRISIVRNFMLAEKNSETGFPNPNDIEILRKTFLNYTRGKNNTKKNVFVSRIGSSRSPHWESDLICELKKLGWEILQCEKKSLQQQIEVFQEAKTICGVHGAGLSGIVWADSGIRIIELSESYRSSCFRNLALILDQEFHTIETKNKEYIDIFKLIKDLS